jgi:hypothetical protein
MAHMEIPTIVAELEARMTISKSTMEDSADRVQASQSALHVIAGCLRELHEFVKSYTFTDEQEEIDFFKRIKPKFLSQYYYHKHIKVITMREPFDRERELEGYYRKALADLQDLLDDDLPFADYLATGQTHLDRLYFRRGFLAKDDFDPYPEFCTGYDERAARILAAGMMRDHIVHLLQKRHVEESRSTLNWTGSKADMIELIYGLETVGVINKGSADIKEIASCFEALFNINLGNYYRQFLDIRLRKKEKTTFLNQMQERLEQRMNDFG